MSKLPGWAFMLAGAFIVLYSIFIQNKTDGNMGFFYVLGILFVIWGFLREFRERVLRTKKKPPKETVYPPKRHQRQETHKHPAGHKVHGQSPHETHVHTRPHGHQHHSHPHEKPHKQCPDCHGYNALHQQNCSKCGHQFY